MLAASLASAQRVFLFSLDGLGHETLTTDPVAQELTTLWGIRKQGVMAQGMQAAFPSTTANSHCALFTGVYGDVNNVTGNNPPMLPRAEHAFTDRGNGFRSDQLAVEPVWVTAARQGVRTVAQNVTQAYPFVSKNTDPDAVVVNAYQTKTIAPAMVVRMKDVTPEPGSWWTKPIESRLPPKTFRWQSGPYTLHGALIARGEVYDAIRVAVEPDKAWVVPLHATESEPPRSGRPLARYFVEGLFFSRLWEVAKDGSDFLLFLAEVKEVGQSGGKDERGRIVPNGAHGLHTSGSFGKGEEADRRYLETVELCTLTLRRKLESGFRANQPRLMIGYLPFPDEFDHEWLGLARSGSAQHQEARRWGYQVVERFMSWIPEHAASTDHVVLVSDHGMSGITKSVAINTALRQAGLEGLAIHFYNSILVNTTDWKGGRVKAANRAKVIAQAREALAGIRDLEKGVPVIRSFYTPEEDREKYGIGGPAGGDLYFDFAPGYRATSESRSGQIVERLPHAQGVHGFDPLRADMLAILVASGPRLQAGSDWPRLRSTQVVPLLADLLGIQPPPLSRAPSPLAISSPR